MTNRPTALRTDLSFNDINDDSRAVRVVIDDVSGTFSRIAVQTWNLLAGGRADDSMVDQAIAANWTRHRIEATPRRSSIFAIRIPLGSIDGVAKYLAPRCGFLFSTIAISFWLAFITTMFLLVLARYEAWIATFSQLPQYLRSANPVWIGGVFVATKIVHEMAHAVTCRRFGARCQAVGLFLFCGIPCPYCDVTEVWRLPSAVSRAFVMLAGIYIELIIAAIAALIWMLSSDAENQFIAMNLMLVAGLSTLLFNANPLMRYDGYYVLADMVGSVDLRREAMLAYQSFVMCRIAGQEYANQSLYISRRSDRRGLLLSIYHLASTAYRFAVLFAIAALIISASSWLQLRPLAFVFVGCWVVLMLGQFTRKIYCMISGRNLWVHVPILRRTLIAGLLLFLCLAVLLIPLPRKRQLDGYLDATDTNAIFLDPNQLIESISVDLGQIVHKGDLVATLNDDALRYERTELEGQLKLATLRRDLARRDSLGNSSRQYSASTQHWATLREAEKSILDLLNQADKRLCNREVRAPLDGVIIPASARSKNVNDRWLSAWIGRNTSSTDPLCRIAKSGMRHAVFVVDARDRKWIQKGTLIHIDLFSNNSTSLAPRFVDSRVQSISAIESDDQSVVREAKYEVLVPVSTIGHEQILASIGTQCAAVHQFPLQKQHEFYHFAPTLLRNAPALCH